MDYAIRQILTELAAAWTLQELQAAAEREEVRIAELDKQIHLYTAISTRGAGLLDPFYRQVHRNDAVQKALEFQKQAEPHRANLARLKVMMEACKPSASST